MTKAQLEEENKRVSLYNKELEVELEETRKELKQAKIQITYDAEFVTSVEEYINTLAGYRLALNKGIVYVERGSVGTLDIYPSPSKYSNNTIVDLELRHRVTRDKYQKHTDLSQYEDYRTAKGKGVNYG